jgi:hypothetical protein
MLEHVASACLPHVHLPCLYPLIFTRRQPAGGGTAGGRAAGGGAAGGGAAGARRSSQLEAEQLEAEQLEAEQLEAEQLEADQLETEQLEARFMQLDRMRAGRFASCALALAQPQPRGAPGAGKARKTDLLGLAANGFTPCRVVRHISAAAANKSVELHGRISRADFNFKGADERKCTVFRTWPGTAQCSWRGSVRLGPAKVMYSHIGVTTSILQTQRDAHRIPRGDWRIYAIY